MEREITKANLSLLLIAVATICVIGTAMFYTMQGPLITGLATGTGPVNVTLTALVGLNLNVTFVDFGNIAAGSSNDTTNNIPVPFVVENNGSVSINITVKINETLFFSNETGGNNSSSFQFKADDCNAGSNCSSGETGCYEETTSTTDWENFSVLADEVVINELGYLNTCDESEVDIKIDVPTDEIPGARATTITFTSVQS